MKKYIKIIIGILLIALVFWTFYFLYTKSKPKPIEYTTQTPYYTSIIKKTVASGTVTPEKEVEIKSIVSGILEELFVEAGQHVKKGDIIARIRIIPNMINLNSAEDRFSKSKIAYENAQINYERLKALLDQKVIALSEFQQAELSYKTALEEMKTAQDNLQLVKEGISKRMGKSSNTLIKSTISGMVLDVPVKVGKNVIEANNFNDGTTIASIAEMDKMIFTGKIDEAEVEKIKKGMELLINIGAIETDTFKAVLDYISPKGKTIDKEGRGAIQFEIKARVLLKPNQFIRAGYSANADIILEQKDKVLAIKESLIQYKSDSVLVEIEKSKDVFEKRIIKTGISDGINTEIIKGLSEKDKIKVFQPSEEDKTKK
ncbi:MAG: efflux RND transporter periplasmic adaptor subunit [Cytophagales bacterium]|nr:MAG: efflux RND transporter periplasmic adaptor subunit [Cytophagales bacterium]